MSSHSFVAATALAAFITAGGAGVLSSTAHAGDADFEKCYGVAKAGQSDCQTATTSCAGTSKTDNQADAWIFVPEGTCDKITGGSTSAG
jgi:uncharacterized membrane protein